MIDFGKLRVPTPKEREVQDERRRRQEIAEDTAKRRERSRKALTITLSHDAESRLTMQGTKLVNFHGTQPGGKPVHAVWYVPDHMDQAKFSAIYNHWLEGSVLRLDGYWKPFKNFSGQTRYTFIAQFVQFQAGKGNVYFAGLPPPCLPDKVSETQSRRVPLLNDRPG